MAPKRKGTGHVGGESETIVAAIRDEIGKLREDINGRLDKIIDNTGARWRDHEARLAAVEDKLGIKTH